MLNTGQKSYPSKPKWYISLCFFCIVGNENGKYESLLWEHNFSLSLKMKTVSKGRKAELSTYDLYEQWVISLLGIGHVAQSGKHIHAYTSILHSSDKARMSHWVQCNIFSHFFSHNQKPPLYCMNNVLPSLVTRPVDPMFVLKNRTFFCVV